MMIKNVFMIAFAVYFAFSGCNDQVTPPENLNDLQLRIVSASIGANLMPFIPPDPIGCQVVLAATNTNQTRLLSGLSIIQADVYLSSTNEKLGSILFTSDWDGQLAPTESDTVRLIKITSPVSLFTPVCSKYVYLNLFVRHNFSTSFSFNTDSLRFGCVY